MILGSVLLGVAIGVSVIAIALGVNAYITKQKRGGK